ncbi:LINE-1 reverse transcriptase-like [Vitis vinifera]|uniref:LINE-1 reverse transcriptase-like n=1 Tax=Vitis vinifera TaxID=29760 RepID=A0A438D8D6_VITVI|nr:LINE-1 reverse transcriptase-like [Vitis vinifera]
MFKEFYEHSSFLKSLNNTFLVLIPKKCGAEDLGDFRPISLLGGLYKLLAKVLANRLKRVVDKVVSNSQNAFVRGRQILDASLKANEVIDSWQKRREKGIICKLDIEKAYDSINWKFLLKVLQKMGFGSKWVGWMWSCISSAKFSVMVNGVPAGFFPSSKGLRQGIPCLLISLLWGMEVLDVLIRRAVEGGFLSGCNIRGGSESTLHISHLFFADDTIIFCEARKDHLTHLSWILFWFEAASGLRINLAKSEIIPVGEVVGMEELAIELGCKVGSLPSQYLGLPLRVLNRAPYMWDGMEERVRRRLALWKRQYISKGGRVTLIKSTLASMPIYQMSIFRMPKMVARRLEKGKGTFCGEEDIWRGKLTWLIGRWYVCDKDNLWKQVIKVKYGQEDFGWRPKKAMGAGRATQSDFGQMCGVQRQRCPIVFLISLLWQFKGTQRLRKCGIKIRILRGHKPSGVEDSVLWSKGRRAHFRVKEAYNLLVRSEDTGFPSRSIWVTRVPTKVCFFAWEATWGRVLTLDRLQRRVVRVLWDVVFGLVDVKWVFPETVKDVLVSWRGEEAFSLIGFLEWMAST